MNTKLVFITILAFVLCLGLPVTAHAATNSITLKLQAGHNFVTPGLDSPTTFTAKSLCKNLNVKEIRSLSNSPTTAVWTTYNCKTGGKDFGFKSEYGYMVTTSMATSVTFQGTNDGKFTHPPLLGWNSYGIYYVKEALAGTMKASWLCGPNTDNDLVITEVQRWKNGAWDGYLCNDYNPSWPGTLNNFELKATEGYLVRAKKL